MAANSEHAKVVLLRVGIFDVRVEEVNTLAHLFKVSNSSSFPPPVCTESAEDPI
jgi:hypothetical protein